MVGIVVVTYNRLSLLKECIDALRHQTYKNFRIVIVNNGSTDGTCEWLSLQNDLIVISQENSGGAGGFYTGLKYVAEHAYDYCWFMDDDVICNVDALQELLWAVPLLKQDFGFLCSSVIDRNGNPTNVPEVDLRSQGAYSDWSRFLINGIVKVRSATFVSVFIPVQNIYKYGLPIKEFFIWGDDTEYTIRLSNALPLKSATKLFSVLLASKRPLITELADKLRLKYPLLPTISPCPTMRLEAIRSIIPISCRRYPKSV